MIAGQWAVPEPDPGARGGLHLDDLEPGDTLVVDVLPGEIQPQRLVADLARGGRPPRWAGLTPYDLDPPALDALAAAVTGHAGEAEPFTGDRAGPDPIRPVVVESDDRRQAERFLTRVATGPGPGAVILRYATGQPRRIRWPAGPRRDQTGPDGLGNPALARLTGGRVALYDSIVDAGCRMPPGELAGLIQQSGTIDELTARVAAGLLRNVPEATRTALGFAALLGYCHPRYRSFEPVLESCGHLPWWTRAADRWLRFERAWRPGVLAVCRSDQRPQVALLSRLLGELIEDGAAAAAVEVCLDAGYVGTASDLIAGIGPQLLSAGWPRCVRRWLRRLPWVVRRRHRLLVAQVRAACREGWSAGTTDPPAYRIAVPAQPGDATPPPRPAVPSDASPLLLRAALLGPVSIEIGGRGVAHWHGHKGRQLLAYLLLHEPGQPVSREVLAATFWPEASPGVSRNRLHVALHTLRADLQTVSTVPIVVFRQGYQVNRELTTWLDTAEFERAIAQGQQGEKDENPAAALAAYREAAHLYRGDLLCDQTCDDWVMLLRERYRVQMLDVLDWIVRLSFDAGRYPESVESAQRLLALDFCREDLHRLLMRAYARMGRPHLALQQFEICSRQLRRELDVVPARETAELYERIKGRAPV